MLLALLLVSRAFLSLIWICCLARVLQRLLHVHVLGSQAGSGELIPLRW